MSVSATNSSAPPRSLRYRGIRVLEVLRKTMITPKMCRITLGGPEMEGFGEGPNLKVLIPPAHLEVPEWPLTGPDGRALWPPGDRRPTVRTYSLRHHRRAAGEIEIDFVMHGEGGIAARWAAQATIGDTVGIGGPGGRTVAAADWYVFAGDHAALPAIARILENLPAAAAGHAVIEIPDVSERQPLAHPRGVEVTWVLRGGTPHLAEAVIGLQLPQRGRLFAWAGCESSAMRSIRQHWRDTGRLDRRQILAIGYWRRGMSESVYHDAFNHDRDGDYYRALQEEQGRESGADETEKPA